MLMTVVVSGIILGPAKEEWQPALCTESYMTNSLNNIRVEQQEWKCMVSHCDILPSGSEKYDLKTRLKVALELSRKIIP